MLVNPAFLRYLAWRKTRQRASGYILRDHRAGCKPYVVSDLDWCDERIVNTRLDVAADPRALLAYTGFVREVDRDVAGGDVRVLPHLGVSDVREMRDLGAFSDPGVLDLDEGPCLRAGFVHRPGA